MRRPGRDRLGPEGGRQVRHSDHAAHGHDERVGLSGRHRGGDRWRTIHTYHTEGAGGGHAPDIMEIAAFDNMLPSSTNAPSRPYTINSVDEGVPMVIVTHNLNASDPADLAFAESRVRRDDGRRRHLA